MYISGNIVAPDSPDAWEGRDQGQWLIFDSVNGLDVNGPGTIDGRGQGWWDISCKTHPQSTGCVKLAPTVLSFLQCNKVSMRNISVVNSPQTHILISGCDDFAINSLSIRSPGKSPNTDGIHISSSHGVFITSTNIASGDDCVSIGDNTSNIHISDVNCGPGHGVRQVTDYISKSGNEVKVENISVIRGHFNRTTNGVRIKTWQVGRGHVRGVSFKSINFTDVKNPIIIDQYYCDVRGACKPTFLQAVPCTNIVLDTIELASSTRGSKSILAATMPMEEPWELYNPSHVSYNNLESVHKNQMFQEILLHQTQNGHGLAITSTLGLPSLTSMGSFSVERDKLMVRAQLGGQTLACKTCKLSGAKCSGPSPLKQAPTLMELTSPARALIIRNCTIGTGDDCIAIGGGSSNVDINGVTCGPGHGISFFFFWFLTGAAILKTSAVELSDITYSGINGTSTADDAINLSCSQSAGCTGILIDHVYITSENLGKRTYANCFNAHGTCTHTVPPVKCLLP
ncbi:hypothetical protein C3L33_00331, partial [Rhododendron williamsianum]